MRSAADCQVARWCKSFLLAPVQAAAPP